MRMRGRRFWRGSATLFGAVALGAFAVLFIASWHAAQAVLFAGESDRERGRMWGLACVAAHRAVQAGLVTAPAVPPGPRDAPRDLTVSELRNPPAGFQPFLPAGMGLLDMPGVLDDAGVLTARYGAVVVDGVPMAVCSLSGSGVASRHPALRAGAMMAGIDVVGHVGGTATATAMHAHLPAMQARNVLGPLPAGSLFVTADFGLAHAVERVHRRRVGGRPELSAMEQELVFDTGNSMVGVGTAAAESAEAGSGRVVNRRADGTGVPNTGDAEVRGDLVLRSNDPSMPASLCMAGTTATRALPSSATPRPVCDAATTRVEATGGFAFGGTQAGAQAVFSIPGELGIGTSMRSRGRVTAGTMALSGDLKAGGNVEAGGTVAGGTVETTGEASAVTGTIGSLRVDSCDGCRPPPLGQ